MAKNGLCDSNCSGVSPAAWVSYKNDAPFSSEFACAPRENKLVQRVAEARAAGLSYGQYMARLYEEEVRTK